MEPNLAQLRPIGSSVLTSEEEAPSRPSKPKRLPPIAPIEQPTETRILDFDVETVAAGFADPDWVPQKITCVAWGWIGEDGVQSRVCGPAGIYGTPEKRAFMLEQLLAQIRKAHLLTGHNIARFDLPVINAEAMRLDLEPIRKAFVQDTMWVVRSKGFKKGQDNLGRLLQTPDDKMPLDWQAWQDAYDEDGWATIRRRAETDVRQHQQVRAALIERGFLRSPRRWNG